MAPFETSSHVRNDSFSSYLAQVRQSLSSELTNHPASRRSSFQAIAERPPERDDIDRYELDVFGAEKYFSGTLDVQGYPELLQTYPELVKKRRWTRNTTRSSSCSDTSARSNSVLLPPHDGPKQHRRSFSLRAVFRCSCSDNNAIKVIDDDEADLTHSAKFQNVPSSFESESSSELFELHSVSMGSCQVYERSEASVEWSVKAADVARKRVSGSLERYHGMMDLETAAARPSRVSLG